MATTTNTTTIDPTMTTASRMRCRHRRQLPLRCPYRDYTFANVLRLSATLICACATVSLSFLGCRVEEPSPIVHWVFTNLPPPLSSPLSHPGTSTPLFRYTSLLIWFLSSLTLLVFAHGISLLYPRRLITPCVVTFCVAGVAASSGLLDGVVDWLAAGGQRFAPLQYHQQGGVQVTWRELGVLVVPWCVVLGLCVSMACAGCERRWGAGGVAAAEGIRRVAAGPREKDVEANVEEVQVIFVVVDDEEKA